MNMNTVVPAQAVKEESICDSLRNVNSLENELMNEMAMESMITEADRLEFDTAKMFEFLDFGAFTIFLSLISISMHIFKYL